MNTITIINYFKFLNEWRAIKIQLNNQKSEIYVFKSIG